MWYLRRVVGDSMNPAYRNGQTVIITRARNHKKGDVVIAFVDNRESLKRITNIENGKVFLEGDNKDNSTDSRSYGWIQDRHIVGKVFWPKKRLKLK
jgi:phage repressor protein C with HTH and peptisase S24 domain